MMMADRSTGRVAHQRSRVVARGSLSLRARAVLLAGAALGVSACEIVSGLDGLEAVDCLACDAASPGDSSDDAELSRDAVRDVATEQRRAEAAVDAREVEVLDSSGEELAVGHPHTDADPERLDAPADQSMVEAETTAGDATRTLDGGDGADGDGGDGQARCSIRALDCGTCMYAHANGLGEEFFDCTPVGTYNSAQAIAACEAYTGDATECRSATCGAAAVVCSSGEKTACACWGFAGAGAGHVSAARDPGALGCACPGTTAPTWN